MLDPETTRLYSAEPETFGRVVNDVVRELPPEVRQRFNTIKLVYLAEHDIAGLYERMNGRTVAEVIAAYQGPMPRVLSEGERDGVRYTLYDPTQGTTDPS